MRTPNFIIGGTAAGGTSYLYELLIQHSEIYLPQQRIPEPHYYYKSWEYAKGLDWYLKQYFDDVPSDKIVIGERSSSYLYGGKKVAQRIAKDFPKMKFIFMLRNPIQRTWANYRFTCLQGLEELSFKEAITQEEQRIKESQGIWREIAPYDYTGRGFYAKQLKEFLEFFPKEQILCIKSESLSNANFSPLLKIYEFLGLKEKDFVPSFAPSHTSLSVVNAKLQKELRAYFGDTTFSQLMNSVRREEELITKAEDKEKYEQLKNNIKNIKEVIPENCVNLLQDIFYKDIEDLSKLVNFDVSDWLNPIHLPAGGGG
ncbi:sulfotransferase [Helicobacter sp. MIT 11-5569]|uniref:sulfotransferase domain-containing protein n=1 Tax=Helicobacter sp. MIT 11-5569 TaxID=1548151 RepID=UPI0010FF08CA|nr:sulfotransferase domain-containing protein [Helicobacter sp. MIT 11-5569]TLD84591.1 sulfotransferase [Helicobacter sp. MIT 11-5569]